MNHFLVDGDACDRRKGNLAGNALKQRSSVVLGQVFLDHGVDLGGRHAGADDLGGQMMRAPDQDAGPAHLHHFAIRTEIDHAMLTFL